MAQTQEARQRAAGATNLLEGTTSPPLSGQPVYMATEERTPPLDCVAGKPVDMDKVLKHWWHGHEHDPAAMRDYAARGIVSAADLFEEVADANADRTFIESCEHEGKQLTWAETESHANKVAHWALEAGITQGDVVSLMMENQVSFVPTWLGLAKVGATIACINTNLSEELLEHSVELAGSTHVVVCAACLPRWRSSGCAAMAVGGAPVRCWVAPSEHVPTPALGEGEASLAEALERCPAIRPDRAVRDRVAASDALFYIYTSGTTGKSKAARFTHSRFIGAGVTWSRHMELGAADRYYVTLPLYHGNGGVVAVSACVRSACTMVVRRKFSASRFLPDLRRCRCTATISIGELWRYVHNQPRREDDAENPLRVAAGNGLRADIWAEVVARFGLSKIVEHYGQTEMPSAHPMINSYNVVGSCGFIPNEVRGRMGTEKLVEYDVHSDSVARGEDGFCREVGPNQPGEAIVKLEGEYAGYTSADATAKVIYRDVFEKGDCWYHSGDLLKYDEWGFVFFVDRAGDSYRWKGENVSTNEVCEALGHCPAVAEANVYGVQVPHTDGRVGMASLLLDDSAKGSREEALAAVAAHVDEHLPTYARPAFLRVRQRENEKTGTFKFQKFRFVREGFSPAALREAGEADDLYFRHPKEGRFVAIDDDLYARICANEFRL